MSYTQSMDTVFYKNGTILVDSFKFSTNQNLVIFKVNQQKTIAAENILRLKIDKKEYVSVTASFLNEAPRVYLAERLDNERISIFQLLHISEKGETFKKYFFYKDGKITEIDEMHLNAFYQIYLKNCYNPSENRHLIYDYENISLVLKKYFNCKNRVVKTNNLRKKAWVTNYGVGLNIGENIIANSFFYDNKTHENNKIGCGVVYGINGQINFKYRCALNIGLNFQNIKLNANDSLSFYDDILHLTEKYYFNNFSYRMWNVGLSFNKHFRIDNKLEISVGMGTRFEKVIATKGKFLKSEQVLSEIPKYSTELELLNTRGKLGVELLRLGLVYFPTKNMGIFANYNYTLTDSIINDDITSYQGINIGFHYYFKKK
jgi:hypothetical protein